MVYLQQDAFDPVDAAMPRERQIESLELLKGLIDADFVDRDVLIVPDILANAGGVTVSYEDSHVETHTASTLRGAAALRSRRCTTAL